MNLFTSLVKLYSARICFWRSVVAAVSLHGGQFAAVSCPCSTRNIGHNFRQKDKQNILMKYGVVHRPTCSCGSSYLGQTRRNLINRLEEHSSSDKSEVCRHLTDNPDHKVDFAKPGILSSAGDSARLLILESLFMQKHEPLLNVDSRSAPLYLFNR